MYGDCGIYSFSIVVKNGRRPLLTPNLSFSTIFYRIPRWAPNKLKNQYFEVFIITLLVKLLGELIAVAGYSYYLLFFDILHITYYLLQTIRLMAFLN